MLMKRLGIGLAMAAAALVGGCAEGYGYGGVSAGYGAGGYYDPYYDSGYGSPYYGSGYYPAGYGSYFGWYGDYYYPGTGVYVYDRYRRAHRWSDTQRRYWQARRAGIGHGAVRDNWAGFGRDRGGVPGYQRDLRAGNRGRPGIVRGVRPSGEASRGRWTPEQRQAFIERRRAAAAGTSITPRRTPDARGFSPGTGARGYSRGNGAAGGARGGGGRWSGGRSRSN